MVDPLLLFMIITCWHQTYQFQCCQAFTCIFLRLLKRSIIQVLTRSHPKQVTLTTQIQLWWSGGCDARALVCCWMAATTKLQRYTGVIRIDSARIAVIRHNISQWCQFAAHQSLRPVMSMIVIVPIPRHVRVIAVLIGSGEGLQSLGSFVIAATALSRRAARALLGLA